MHATVDRSSSSYLFQSDRLGFRNWTSDDVDVLSKINADARVMEFFPSTQSRQITRQFVERMQRQFNERGHCYFAVDLLSVERCIGFIGLSYQNYTAYFTPAVDIGWRLHHAYWNQGLATEGARRCLSYGFNVLHLDEIYSVASEQNGKSIRVMEKIGMTRDGHIHHPALKNYAHLSACHVYKITKPV